MRDPLALQASMYDLWNHNSGGSISQYEWICREGKKFQPMEVTRSSGSQ